MGDLMIETLNLRFEELEVLCDNFVKDVAFLFICVYKILGYFLDIFDGVAGMHFFTISMVFDTCLGLADGTGTRTSNATSHHHCFQGM